MNRNLIKLAVPVGVVGIILLLVVPIPAGLLDVQNRRIDLLDAAGLRAIAISYRESK